MSKFFFLPTIHREKLLAKKKEKMVPSSRKRVTQNFQTEIFNESFRLEESTEKLHFLKVFQPSITFRCRNCCFYLERGQFVCNALGTRQAMASSSILPPQRKCSLSQALIQFFISKVYYLKNKRPLLALKRGHQQGTRQHCKLNETLKHEAREVGVCYFDK